MRLASTPCIGIVSFPVSLIEEKILENFNFFYYILKSEQSG